MAKQRLSITHNGTPVGELLHDTATDRFSIRYDEAWKKIGFAISPHIPLDGKSSPHAVDLYLKNLLPEGEGLETLSIFASVSKANTYGLVRAIGLDVSGAMAFGKPPETDEKIFEEVTEERIRERIETEGLSHIAVWNKKVRLSVAGVQAKLAVYLKNGKIGFGDGRLASTYILKFEKRPGSHLALNELFCMQLAKAAGMNVPEVSMKRFGDYNAILVKRFDRAETGEGVMRKHVLDGCQLLNIAPAHKYERNYGSGEAVRHIREGVSFKKLFAAVDRTFKSPAAAKLHMLEWAIFSLLINNADAHGKNISFLSDKQGMELAPFYDMLSVTMHTGLDTASGAKIDQDLAMAFGNEFEIEKVKGYDLIEFSEDIKLPKQLIAKTAQDMCKRVEKALGLTLEDEMSAEERDFIDRLKNLIRKRIDAVRESARYVLDN